VLHKAGNQWPGYARDAATPRSAAKTFGYACCYRVIILFQLSSVGGREIPFNVGDPTPLFYKTPDISALSSGSVRLDWRINAGVQLFGVC